MRVSRVVMVMVVSVIAAMVCGCATTGGPAPAEEVEPDPAPAEAARAALTDAHEALKAGDAARRMAAFSDDYLVSIKLPAPQMSGGRPLMDVLKDRRTTRTFSKAELPDQVLSNLLWAAWGINRPDRNLHTAPSASNQQEIDVYVALAKGLYVYDPGAHELRPVLAEDLRGASGTQRFVKSVPLNLIFVADHSRMYPGSGMDERIKEFYSAANTGFISQNVYLFCASEGLGTVVRGLVDKGRLAKRMQLRPDQKIIFSQSVGYPKESR